MAILGVGYCSTIHNLGFSTFLDFTRPKFSVRVVISCGITHCHKIHSIQNLEIIFFITE